MEMLSKHVPDSGHENIWSSFVYFLSRQVAFFVTFPPLFEKHPAAKFGASNACMCGQGIGWYDHCFSLSILHNIDS